MNDKLRLGWIGTGVMGHAMAGHLLASGYPQTVYNRTKARAEGLLACGARWAATPQEVARNSDVVFSIVGYPRDVEEVMLGEQGALSGLAEGGILCDMTTSSPDLARRIAEAAAVKGCISLDAPVTGGDIGAREARLSIFVGGDKEAFERVRPCFEVMGKTILHCGDSGSGQKAKLANQVAIAGVMAMEPKVLILDEPTAGLDPRGRDEILAQIRAYHETKQATVILVSHSMEEIARNVGRIVVMRDAHVYMDGTPRQVFARAEELEQAGLDVPQVTKIAMALRRRGMDIDPAVYTIEELEQALLNRRGGGEKC